MNSSSFSALVHIPHILWPHFFIKLTVESSYVDRVDKTKVVSINFYGLVTLRVNNNRGERVSNRPEHVDWLLADFFVATKCVNNQIETN